jgi:carboxypeptidase C (cathepsin A)
MLDYSKYVVETLEGGLRWLIYAGDQDFICNWYGNHAWTDSLAWSGSEAFGMAKNTTFQTTDGRDAGTYKSANGLTFLRVNGAGHMVPMDQPLAALQMTITHYNDEFTPL